jgi:hypothetical protein
VGGGGGGAVYKMFLKFSKIETFSFLKHPPLSYSICLTGTHISWHYPFNCYQNAYPWSFLHLKTFLSILTLAAQVKQ